jgi:hypothetical protein
MTGAELWLLHHAVTAALAAASLAIVVIVTLEYLESWFKERSRLRQNDRDVIAFTLKQSIATGGFNVRSGVFSNTLVQGFYDRQENKVLELRKIKAGSVAPEVVALHSKPVVVWE